MAKKKVKIEEPEVQPEVAVAVPAPEPVVKTAKVKKEPVVHKAADVTLDDIHGTMAYLRPRLQNPKTAEEAKAELADFSDRFKKQKPNPTWK